MGSRCWVESNFISEKRKVNLLCKILFLEFYEYKIPFLEEGISKKYKELENKIDDEKE